MKDKKPDGKGQDVPTHQPKNEPKDAFGKMIHEAAICGLRIFKQRLKK